MNVALLGTGKMGTAIARRLAAAGRRHGASMPLLALSRELYAMAEPEHCRREMTAVIERYLR